jgi:hypothetical protein
MAPLPAVALPSLQLYKRIMRIEEQLAALNSHREGWSNWERFIFMIFNIFIINLTLLNARAKKIFPARRNLYL